MSVTFNGTTSDIVGNAVRNGAYITTGSVYTYLIWALANTTGEGGLGVAWSFGAATTRPVLQYSAANTLQLTQGYSTTNGIFTFPAATGQLNAIAVVYDRSGLAAPIVRVNFQSVTVTTTTAPVGTYVAGANNYRLGQNTSGAQTWDGWLAHFQVFNVALSPGEQDEALRYPGKIARGQILWHALEHPSDLYDRVYGAKLTTMTAITQGPPPPCSPWPSPSNLGLAA